MRLFITLPLSLIRCVNRTVGNGLQFSLQVCPVRIPVMQTTMGNKSAHHHSSMPIIQDQARGSHKRPVVDMSTTKGPQDSKWTVVTLEDIPMGAFICEYVGQYIVGGKSLKLCAIIIITITIIIITITIVITILCCYSYLQLIIV